MLKIYCGQDVIHQDPEDIDPDRWLEEGELTQLTEEPLSKAQKRSRQLSVDWRDPEISQEPELEIQVIPEDPEQIAVREGVHKRIQVEINHEDMEDKDIQPATEGAAKQELPN